MTDFITILEDGTKILSEDVFEKIIDELFSKVDFNYTYEKGYKSNDWYEPDEPASIEVDLVSVNLTLEELQEYIPITNETVELLDDAVDNADTYEFWDDAISELISELESMISSYSVEDYTTHISFNKDKGINFSFEVDDYSFNENDYIYDNDPRNEYDPSEDF